MNTLRTVPVALTLAAAVAAQIPIEPSSTRGTMPAYPAGVIMSVSPTSEIEKKPAGLPILQLDPFNRSGEVPDYSVAEITRGLPTSVSPLVIDAMSSGNDALPLLYLPDHGLPSGKFWISQGNVAGWAVLYLAMEDDSRIEAILGPGQNDAVMGYYFDNPSFPQQLRSGIYFELLPNDFPVAGIPSSLDTAMGLLEDNHGRLVTNGPDPVIHRVYFSLTLASAQALFNDLQTAQPPVQLNHISGVPYTPPPGSGFTGATIFVAEFTPSLLGFDVQVMVCEDWFTLGIGQEADIDALGVAWAQVVPPPRPEFQPLVSDTLQYVFSLDGAPADELLVSAVVSGGRKRGPLRGNNGDEIVGGTAGSLVGRVRAICSQDPEPGVLGGSAYGECDNYGTPDTGVLSLSLAVRNTASHQQTYAIDNFELTAVVSGWGGWTPEASFVWLRMQVIGYGWQVETFLGPWSRAATDDYLTLTLAPPTYPFQDVPWAGTPWNHEQAGSQLVQTANRFRLSVYQVGLSQSHAPTESWRSLVFRSQ